MSIKQLTDDEALDLNGTTDADTGLQYPQLLEANWGAAVLRALNQFLKVAFTDLMVIEIDGNADAVGVLPGVATIGGTLMEYGGDTDSGGAVDGLTDDDTTYIWLEDDGGGNPQVNSAVDGTGWPGTAHVKLAKVTMSSGAITEIKDMRGAAALTG